LNLGRILVELRAVADSITVEGDRLKLQLSQKPGATITPTITEAVNYHRSALVRRLQEERGPYIDSPRYWQIERLYRIAKALRDRAQASDGNFEQAVVLVSLIREWDDACYRSWEEADRWEAENADRLLRLFEVAAERPLAGHELADQILETFPGSTPAEPGQNQEAA
jgi:hypothetical protein